MRDVHSFIDLYDEAIVPMLLEMNPDQYSYFTLGASLVMLAASRTVIEGGDLLEVMGEIESEAVRFDRMSLATRMLMLGAFLDKVNGR